MKALAIVCMLGLAACASVPNEPPSWRIEPQTSVSTGRKDHERHDEFALQLAGQGRYAQAIAHFRQAVALAPQLAHLHNNLGYAYLLSGSNEQAARSFEEALRLDPQYAKALENLRLARLPVATPPARQGAAPTPAENAEVVLREVAPYVYELERATKVPLAPARMRKARLEVVNGNGAPGMARRVADALGVRAARLSNQRPFKQAATEIQYRAGYAEAAEMLSRRLDGVVRAVHSDRLEARGVDVRLVLGRDRLRGAT